MLKVILRFIRQSDVPILVTFSPKGTTFVGASYKSLVPIFYQKSDCAIAAAPPLSQKLIFLRFKPPLAALICRLCRRTIMNLRMEIQFMERSFVAAKFAWLHFRSCAGISARFLAAPLRQNWKF